METILELLSRGVEQLRGRAGGPLHFRLVMMPTVVSVLAIRAGLRDARAGRPAFLWALLTAPSERRELVRSALKDIGRVLVFACVLDGIYQLTFLHEFHLVQMLIVAIACAAVPYALVRGPANRVARCVRARRSRTSEELE